MKDRKLCFIRKVGENSDGYIYEFFFNDDIDSFWGEHFGEKPASTVNDLKPDGEFSNDMERVVLKLELELTTDSNCFSYQDAMDGIVCVGWCYDEEKFVGRFRYGEDKEITDKTISQINQ